jgi:hypothetical protein
MSISEDFREQHDPRANYARLEDAVAMELPPEDSCPVEQSLWVADTIHEMTEGHKAAGFHSEFGVVYGALSYDIAHGVKNKEFDEPVVLARQMAGFLDCWREPAGAVVRYMRGEDEALDDMTKCWEIFYFDPRIQKAEPVTQFAEGMFSHIGVDLPLSLAKKHPPESYHHDFKVKVGAKIDVTARRFSSELIPGHPLVRKAVIPLIVGSIAVMREQAWRDFKAIEWMPEKEQQVESQKFDRRTARVMDLLLRVDDPMMRVARLTEHFPSWARSTDEQEAA